MEVLPPGEAFPSRRDNIPEARVHAPIPTPQLPHSMSLSLGSAGSFPGWAGSLFEPGLAESADEVMGRRRVKERRVFPDDGTRARCG